MLITPLKFFGTLYVLIHRITLFFARYVTLLYVFPRFCLKGDLKGSLHPLPMQDKKRRNKTHE